MGDSDRPFGGISYWGKYRGVVIDNVDVTQTGRILVEVAALPEMTLNWAVPCAPWTGIDEGAFSVPPLGANVWVEFEKGDLERPVWTGCF